MIGSPATQTLVIFVIRTLGNPFSSPPSVALIATAEVVKRRVLAGLWRVSP
ncbi:MAG TPA: hypothetical protein VGU22_15145 [Methylomirabilota bacterium]|nr:hypothetical protein [Methylomirabilota bacterium]